jgi:hypothetical protein
MQYLDRTWAGVGRSFRLYRDAEESHHGIFDKPVGQLVPTPGLIVIVAAIPDSYSLNGSQVAHRVAALLEAQGGYAWKHLVRVTDEAISTLAKLHGLDRKHYEHVATTHAGRHISDYSHFVADLFAEYLLSGKVALHDSGGAVHVETPTKRWTAYAQPGHQDESKKTLAKFEADFGRVADEVLDTLEGKILVG